jgi:hypothetical protein
MVTIKRISSFVKKRRKPLAGFFRKLLKAPYRAEILPPRPGPYSGSEETYLTCVENANTGNAPVFKSGARTKRVQSKRLPAHVW